MRVASGDDVEMRCSIAALIFSRGPNCRRRACSSRSLGLQTALWQKVRRRWDSAPERMWVPLSRASMLDILLIVAIVDGAVV